MAKEKRGWWNLDIGTITEPDKPQLISFRLRSGHLGGSEKQSLSRDVDVRVARFVIIAGAMGVPALCYFLGRLGH